MTRIQLTLTVFMLAATSVCSSQAFAQRATAEYLFMSRNSDSSQTLIGPSALSADDASFGYDSGFRFSLGYGIGDYDIEAVFSRIPSWEAVDSGVLSQPLIFNDDPMDFLGGGNTLPFRNNWTSQALEDTANVFSLDPGARFRYRYESTLDDFQLNFGTSRTNKSYWAALGWRHVELDERSNLFVFGDFRSTDAMAGTNPGGAFSPTGYTALQGDGSFSGYDPLAMPPTITTVGLSFDGVTDNDLDGAQILLGGRIQARDLLIIEPFMTLGLFHNRAEGTVVETIVALENDTDILRRSFSDADTVASFMGSLGFRLIVPLTDYIFLRAGYEGMLVTNVALGPDQTQGLGTTLLGQDFYKVKTGGNVIAHGGTLGLGVTW